MGTDSTWSAGTRMGTAVETPKYLQTLWSYKWLLAFGLIVAIVAAFFAGFTITNGQVESRAVKSYTAGTTVLVTSQTDTLYQAQIPAQPIEQGVSAPEPLDLSASTQIYAYIVAGARGEGRGRGRDRPARRRHRVDHRHPPHHAAGR